MVERQLKKRILNLLTHFPAVAILGARQVGKTTLSKMTMKEIETSSLYLDLENPTDAAKLENPTAFFTSNQTHCIIIDEVQRRPDLFPMLRSMIDQHRVPARFLLLGSANPSLIKLTSETLAGRIVYTELTPFTLAEIQSLKSMQIHWLNGGFPEPFLLDNDDIRTEWFNSFIMTYLERDLPLIGLKTSPMLLLRFITMIAHSHGQLLNKSTFAKSLEVSVPTVATYLLYLEHAFMVRSLPPHFTNLKKRLVKSPKVYIRDSGILHNLLKISFYNTLLGHPILGHSWEGYVIEQIISILGNQYEYAFYRTQDGAECDLVITEKFTPIASVEIKFTSTPKLSKGLKLAFHDINAPDNFIIIPQCDEPYPFSDGITVCDIFGFIRFIQNKSKS